MNFYFYTYSFYILLEQYNYLGSLKPIEPQPVQPASHTRKKEVLPMSCNSWISSVVSSTSVLLAKLNRLISR